MKGSAYIFGLWLVVLGGPAVQAQVNWGLTGGGSLVSFSPKQQPPPSPFGLINPGTYSSLSAWSAGVVAESPLSRHWALDASLSYTGNGSHAFYGVYSFDGGQTSTFTMRLGYLRLPIEAIYQFNPGRRVRFMAGGGLYAAYALWGREKGSMVSIFGNGGPMTSSIDNRIAITNKAPTPGDFYPTAVKPFDAGYTVMAAAQWAHFRLIPSFSQGFVNLFPGETFKGKNKGFSLSMVYWIRGG
jgi:hypothetical protein